MNDPQQQAAEPVAPPARAEHEDAGKRFEQACQSYLTALQELQLQAQRHCMEANRNYIEAAQRSWLDAQRRFSQAQQQYAAAVEDAWGREDAPNLTLEAYRTYVRALRAACEETQKQYEEAYGRYTDPLKQLSAELKERWEQVYRDYINAVKEGWTAAEADSIDVNTLAAISQSLNVAALFTVNTVGLCSAQSQERLRLLDLMQPSARPSGLSPTGPE